MEVEILRARYLHQVTAFPDVRALFKQLRSDGRQGIRPGLFGQEGQLAKYNQLAQIGDLIHTEFFLGRCRKKASRIPRPSGRF